MKSLGTKSPQNVQSSTKNQSTCTVTVISTQTIITTGTYTWHKTSSESTLPIDNFLTLLAQPTCNKHN